MSFTKKLVFSSLLAAVANAQNATVLPDGRIAADAVPEDFNVLASVFKSAVVKGDGM